ncbi:hypothetical protein LP420_32365 [Massilia sp. B-10]|nr:hypothetical protein LP420_32365 [Massilia sp. B-10]
MNKFKAALSEAIRCYLEPYFDNEDELFIDTEQLGGGDDIDRRIAPLCESVSMILIYTPKYEAHGYTRREYAAMQMLEHERGQWYPMPSHLIIPVIMTMHPAKLPPQITNSSLYVDFSHFTMATSDLKSNPDFLPDIKRLSERIVIHYQYQKGTRPWAMTATNSCSPMSHLNGAICRICLSQKNRGALMELKRITLPPITAPGEVTTFYSFESGTARSIALSNTAVLLAGRDNATVPVLMIDWDTESPGLHHHFGRQDARPGLLEYFQACQDHLRTLGHGPAAADDTALARCVLEAVDWELYVERVDQSRPLYLMRL